MPTTETSTSGRVRHIRPLPSDSTTTSVPVSATAKLAPETATLARRNFSRRCSRAAPASSAGSSVRSSGAGLPAAAIRSRKISRISARLRWIAGTRMWLGRSSPSCTISSARSVSQAAMPSAASASLSPISWVTIDLTLTTSSTPWALATSATIAVGLGGVARPVHRAAGRGQRRLELEQVLLEVGQGGVLDRGAGEPQLLPVRRPRRPPGPACRGSWRSRARGCAAAGCRRARRARPRGTAGIPTKVAVDGDVMSPPGPRPGASCVRRPAGG